jgi:hypothetical protein
MEKGYEANAFLEYLFTFKDRYDQYKKRQDVKNKKKRTPQDKDSIIDT